MCICIVEQHAPDLIEFCFLQHFLQALAVCWEDAYAIPQVIQNESKVRWVAVNEDATLQQ